VNKLQLEKFALRIYVNGNDSLAQIGAEVPIDSEEADEENRSEKGKTLLYVFERGFAGIICTFGMQHKGRCGL
jgi:hypothetical protein